MIKRLLEELKYRGKTINITKEEERPDLIALTKQWKRIWARQAGELLLQGVSSELLL